MPRSSDQIATAANIRTLTDRCRVSGKRAAYKVEGQRGLWLRISPAGTASWSLVYRLKGLDGVQRYSIGPVADYTLKEAREVAALWMPRVSEGIDPREQRKAKVASTIKEREEIDRKAAEKAARLTVRDAVDRFIVAKAKARAVYHMGRMLQLNLVVTYGDMAIADLTRNYIEEIQATIVGRGRLRHADNVLSTIRSLLSWCKSKRHVTENVASRFERMQGPHEGVRDRKLTAAEVRALWLLLERDDVKLSLSSRRAFKLTILLGSRIGEICGMRKGELSAGNMVWTVPASRMKAKREHVLPLPPMARTIIAETLADANCSYLFATREGKPPRSTSLSHAMGKLQAELNFKDANDDPLPVKLHDLRRTMATGLQHLGVSADVIKAALAHTESGNVTTTHYAQSSLANEVREALTRWQAAVAAMVRGEDPFAVRAEATAEMERRILGQDPTVSAEPATAPNVVPLRAVG